MSILPFRDEQDLQGRRDGTSPVASNPASNYPMSGLRGDRSHCKIDARNWDRSTCSIIPSITNK